MIKNTAFQAAAFISMIGLRLQGEIVPPSDIDRAIDPYGDHVVYFGAGYWRGKLRLDFDDRVTGCTLINPNRTPQEIAIVEQAIAILCRLEYSA